MAEEFKANGYNVGEMDNILLKKIEELTLYTIEQQKAIKQLQVENAALKKEKKEITGIKAELNSIKQQLNELKSK